MNNDKRGVRGFTMVELVVVMGIILILATIAIPMYRVYISRARAQEGITLVGAIASSQRIYHQEYNRYLRIPETTYCRTTGVDARGNLYFRVFSTEADADTFTIMSYGTGDAAGIIVSATGGVEFPTHVTEVFPHDHVKKF